MKSIPVICLTPRIVCFILPQASSYENRWDGWYGDEAKYVQTGSKGGKRLARPSLIPSLCTHFTRAGIKWRR